MSKDEKNEQELPVMTLPTRREPSQARSVAAIESILDATARLLVSRGHEGTTTTLVAAEAGVSVGSVYQYFKNKEALVVAVAKRHAERQLQHVQSVAMGLVGVPLPEIIRAMCNALIEAHQLDEPLNRVLVQQVTHVGREHHWAVERVARSVVRGLLAAHQDEITPTDLDTASFVLVALVEGIVYSALLQEGEGAPELDRLRDETVAVILRYLLSDLT